MWTYILPILGFMGLSIPELGRGTTQTERQHASFYNAPPMEVEGIIMWRFERRVSVQQLV